MESMATKFSVDEFRGRPFFTVVRVRPLVDKGIELDLYRPADFLAEGLL